MRRLPGAVFIVDPHREAIAVSEARRLEIPVIAITDTNCNPDLIDYVIPANDDAIRSVRLLCTLVADACLAGAAERQARIDEEMETVEALPPVDEAALGPDADYSAALASGEALVFEPEPEEDEETERRARARRAASLEFDESLDETLDAESIDAAIDSVVDGAAVDAAVGAVVTEDAPPRCDRGARRGAGMTMETKPMIGPDEIRALREQTGAGVMDCKRALEASGGDVDAAVAYLREQGLATARKKADRDVREGVIASYIHHGSRLGVLLELNCETDFVARTDDFQQLARELAMQVAGLSPTWVSRDDVPAEIVASQREQFAAEAAESGRPADRIDDIVTGKLDKWFETVCLLDLPYRDTDRRIGDLITDKVAVLGENIRVARFARMAVGESGGGADQDPQPEA